MKLVSTHTGAEIKEGDLVTTFRGEPGVLKTIRPNEGKHGRVYVKLNGSEFSREFYPGVIGAEFRA